MSFIVELKHAFGIQRDDQEQIKAKAVKASKDNDRKSIKEFCSMLDLKNNELNNDLAYNLCDAIFRESGHNLEIFNLAKRMADHFNDSKFLLICAYVQEYWGQQNLNEAMEMEIPTSEFVNKVEDKAIGMYNSALSWLKNNDSNESAGLKERIEQKILKAWGGVGDKYYLHGSTYSDDMEGRDRLKFVLSMSIKYYERAGMIKWANTIREELKQLENRVQQDKALLKTPLNHIPDASSFANKLMKAGYKTLEDVKNATNEELDNVKGIGTETYPDVISFKEKYK